MEEVLDKDNEDEHETGSEVIPDGPKKKKKKQKKKKKIAKTGKSSQEEIPPGKGLM